MNILEAMISLRDDLKTWVANNLKTKVDKVDNMGLSSNDFTTEEKEKLAGLSAEHTHDYLPISGGTLTGNLTAPWLQTAAVTEKATAATKIAVLDDNGWIYYRSASNLLGDVGAAASEHVHGMLRAYNAEPRRTDADFWSEDNGGLTKFLATSSMTNNKPMADGHIIHCFWDSDTGWDGQLFVPCSSNGQLQYRSKNGGTWESWKTVLDSSNYTDYISASGGTAGMIEEFNTVAMTAESYSPGVHESRFYIVELYHATNDCYCTIVINWYALYYLGTHSYSSSGTNILTASMSNYVPTFTATNGWVIKQVCGFY